MPCREPSFIRAFPISCHLERIRADENCFALSGIPVIFVRADAFNPLCELLIDRSGKRRLRGRSIIYRIEKEQPVAVIQL